MPGSDGKLEIRPYVAGMPTGAGMQQNTTKGTIAKYKDDDRDAVTDAEKQGVMDKLSERTYGVRDSYGEAEANRALRHFGMNLGRNDAYGNLNGKSFASTQNLSRLVDKLNNREYILGGRMAVHNSGRSGSREGSVLEIGRKEPIETQETRQMRQNERIAELARQGQVSQQQAVNEHSLELQKAADDNVNKMASLLGVNEAKMQSAFREAMLNVDFSKPLETQIFMQMQRFLQKLALETKSDAMQEMVQAWNDHGPATSAVAAAGYGTSSMGVNDFIIQNMYKPILDDPNYSDETKFALLRANDAVLAITEQGTALTNGVLNGFVQQFATRDEAKKYVNEELAKMRKDLDASKKRGN